MAKPAGRKKCFPACAWTFSVSSHWSSCLLRPLTLQLPFPTEKIPFGAASYFTLWTSKSPLWKSSFFFTAGLEWFCSALQLFIFLFMGHFFGFVFLSCVVFAVTCPEWGLKQINFPEMQFWEGCTRERIWEGLYYCVYSYLSLLISN